MGNTSEKKKHILVISQYFYPETFRINDICLDLIERGFKVTVLTGYPNYPDGKFYDHYKANKVSEEIYKGIKIIRLPIIARGKNKITLVLNYLSFIISGYVWKSFTNLSADFVFIYEVSPMTQALPGVWYAKKLNIPCYLYVLDLWPENVQIAGNVSNNLILYAIGKMVDFIYKNCSLILTSSQSFIDRISERGVPKAKLEFWPQYAEDYYYPVEVNEIKSNEIPNDGILNLTFAGNIGYAQGLEILPKVASLLKDSDIIIRFNVIGNGRYKDELVSLINIYDVNQYFNIIDSKPPEVIKEYLTVSDGALIILSKSELFEMTIPAKVQSSLACGIPLIGSISGETKDIIDSSNIGFCSEAGDIEGLYSNILKFRELSVTERKSMRENARNFYETRFDKKMLMNSLSKKFI